MEYVGKTGIIPFTYFLGTGKRSGSTILRVETLVAHTPDFEKWIHGARYDNLIFQKAYWTEMMDMFEGPKILDLCDPDWVQQSLDIVDIVKRVHAVTCSSAELAELIRKIFPDKIVEHVPDRFSFKIFPEPREEHSGRAKNAVWFGFMNNVHETLPQMYEKLKENGLKLRLIADKPYENEDGIASLEPEYIPYTTNAEVYGLLRDADMVLNPRSHRAFFKYKSNNKSVIAWKMGLPVAVTPDDIDRLMEPDERNREVEAMKETVDAEYGIRKSAQQYRSIISEIKRRYF